MPGCRLVKGSASPAKIFRIVGVRSVGVAEEVAAAPDSGAGAPAGSGLELQAPTASMTATASGRPSRFLIMVLCTNRRPS